jgi:hypothetical protein
MNTLFAIGMPRLFSCSVLSETLKSSGEKDHLSFDYIDLYVPAFTADSLQIHCSEAALQFADNTMFMFLCHLNTGVIC